MSRGQPVAGGVEAGFVHLERAQDLAQRMMVPHTRVHWLLRVTRWPRRYWREVTGQVPRILASVLCATIRVPRGTTGRVRASALGPMPLPADLRDRVA